MSESTSEPCPERVELDRKLEAVAADTGIALDTVRWINHALTFLGCYRRKGVLDHHVNAAEFCRMLIADISTRNPEQVRAVLEANGIASGRDVGRVVYALVGVGLCNQGEGDSESDFASIFERDDIEGYLQRSGVRAQRDWPMTIKSAVMWTFYSVGVALAVTRNELRWNHTPIWVASALILAGWLVSKIRYPRRMRFGLPWSTLEPRRSLERAKA
jgi:uncharacterized repeat protein (TIGR04138 family)